MLNLDTRYEEAEAHLQRAERMFTLGGTARTRSGCARQASTSGAPPSGG
jgi:hypothetical protein